MATSRVAAAIDNLMARFAAAAALAGVQVLDGPPVTADPLNEAVFVGFDGDPEGDGQAATFDQAWSGLGAKAKDETLVVTCGAVVWRGDNDAVARAAARTRVFALLAAVEDVLRADPAIGFPPPAIAAMQSGRLFQRQFSGGFEARVPFQVGVQVRI